MATQTLQSPKLLAAWNHLGNKTTIVLPNELRKAHDLRRATQLAIGQTGKKH